MNSATTHNEVAINHVIAVTVGIGAIWKKVLCFVIPKNKSPETCSVPTELRGRSVHGNLQVDNVI